MWYHKSEWSLTYMWYAFLHCEICYKCLYNVRFGPAKILKKFLIFTNYGNYVCSWKGVESNQFIQITPITENLCWSWLVAWLVPNHYLNQCWNIVNWTPRTKLQNSCIFIQENPFQNVICKMAAILSRPQCDKTPGPFCVPGFPVMPRCRFLNSLVMCVSLTLTTYVVSSTIITQLQHNTVYYTQGVTEGDQGTMSLKILPSHNYFKFDISCKFYLGATIFCSWQLCYHYMC